jgi:hypothetical protein
VRAEDGLFFFLRFLFALKLSGWPMRISDAGEGVDVVQQDEKQFSARGNYPHYIVRRDRNFHIWGDGFDRQSSASDGSR